MTASVRGVYGYALTKTPVATSMRGIVGYALVEERTIIGPGKTGYRAVLDMVLGLTHHTFPEGSLTLSAPSSSGDAGNNTQVSATAGPASLLSGSMTFVYQRKPLAEIMSELPVEAFDVSAYSTVHELLDDLNTLTGMMFEPIDFENTPITGSSVSLQAASSSYYFIPGTQFLLGT